MYCKTINLFSTFVSLVLSPGPRYQLIPTKNLNRMLMFCIFLCVCEKQFATISNFVIKFIAKQKRKRTIFEILNQAEFVGRLFVARETVHFCTITQVLSQRVWQDSQRKKFLSLWTRACRVRNNKTVCITVHLPLNKTTAIKKCQLSTNGQKKAIIVIFFHFGTKVTNLPASPPLPWNQLWNCFSKFHLCVLNFRTHFEHKQQQAKPKNKQRLQHGWWNWCGVAWDILSTTESETPIFSDWHPIITSTISGFRFTFQFKGPSCLWFWLTWGMFNMLQHTRGNQQSSFSEMTTLKGRSVMMIKRGCKGDWL